LTKGMKALRNKLALNLGRGLGVLFIAMGVTVAILSLVVIEPFHRTMHYMDESLQSAEGLARNVQSGVEKLVRDHRRCIKFTCGNRIRP